MKKILVTQVACSELSQHAKPESESCIPQESSNFAEEAGKADTSNQQIIFSSRSGDNSHRAANIPMEANSRGDSNGRQSAQQHNNQQIPEYEGPETPGFIRIQPHPVQQTSEARAFSPNAPNWVNLRSMIA